MATSSASCTVRNDGLDALRGLLLVLMTVTHMPTAFSAWMGQPFGYVSAAEGFVMLSAFLAGQVYLRRGLGQGVPAMRRALWSRAAKVYRHHLALLAFGASVILAIGVAQQQGAITSMFTFYMKEPLVAASAALLLIYQPALFDILPMYVMFLLLTPFVLQHAMRRGWTLPLAASLLIWVASWLGLRVSFHQGLMALTGWNLPLHATGAFNPFAWQLLWMIGLWLGTAQLQNAQRLQAPPRVIALLAALALSFVAWRHFGGYAPFGSGDAAADLNRLVAKWNLGPMRLLNLFTLTVLIAAAGPWLIRHLPLQPLVRLGRASLPVFSAHLVCCLAAMAVFGSAARKDGSLGLDLALVLGSLTVLYLTAAANAWHRSRPVTVTAPAATPAPIGG
ncbi:OpgC domain-containing protein [Panacagrimonas sp.]|uniref:OpgC domain-containing protein n=1 Tax=Panacagrimonas sp. TaxID=2480088 RepID=UPI003B51ADDF